MTPMPTLGAEEDRDRSWEGAKQNRSRHTVTPSHCSIAHNLGRHSAEEIIPELQHIEEGDWISMGGKATETTAMRVGALEKHKWLLWEHLGAQWVWVLRPIDENTTRLITRGRQRYHWTSPMLISELILMEIGDFFMMRKLLLNLKARAERLALQRREQQNEMWGGPRRRRK
jgi:hypothetical protein